MPDGTTTTVLLEETTTIDENEGNILLVFYELNNITALNKPKWSNY